MRPPHTVQHRATTIVVCSCSCPCCCCWPLSVFHFSCRVLLDSLRPFQLGFSPSSFSSSVSLQQLRNLRCPPSLLLASTSRTAPTSRGFCFRMDFFSPWIPSPWRCLSNRWPRDWMADARSTRGLGIGGGTGGRVGDLAVFSLENVERGSWRPNTSSRQKFLRFSKYWFKIIFS